MLIAEYKLISGFPVEDISQPYLVCGILLGSNFNNMHKRNIYIIIILITT